LWPKIYFNFVKDVKGVKEVKDEMIRDGQVRVIVEEMRLDEKEYFL